MTMGCANDKIANTSATKVNDADEVVDTGSANAAQSADTGIIDDSVLASHTNLMGTVLSIEGAPLEGVIITTTTGEHTSTDILGRYKIENASLVTNINERIGVTFELSGYTKNVKPITIVEDIDNLLNVRLDQPDAVLMFSASEGISDADSIEGLHITIQPGSLYSTVTGEVYEGQVALSVTKYEVGNATSRTAAPGDLTGINESGEVINLESYGMFSADLTGMPNGEILQLSEDMPASIEMVISAAWTADAVEEIPAWSFNETTLRWDYEGVGTNTAVYPGTGEAYTTWSFEPTHFSSWNSDMPWPAPSCVQCTVINNNGQTVSGARIEVNGSERAYDSVGVSGADGKVCVEAVNGSLANLNISYSFDGIPYTNSQEIAVPPGNNPCGADGECSFSPDCTIDIPL